MNSQVASSSGTALFMTGLVLVGVQVLSFGLTTPQQLVHSVQAPLGYWGLALLAVGMVLWCAAGGLPTPETLEKRRAAREQRRAEDVARQQRLTDADRQAQAEVGKREREIQDFGAVLARALETSEPSTSRNLKLTVKVGDASVTVENAFDVEKEQRAKAIAEATERVRIANEQARLGTQSSTSAVAASKSAIPPPDDKNGKW